MLPITVYNQKGGQGKSTITRDLAATFTELGLDVLIVDFDAQDKSVSNYLGVDDDKRNPDADHIALHLIDQPKGEFDDLIESVPYNENLDVIPSHKKFGEVDDMLSKHEDYVAPTKPDDWEYPRYKRFFQILNDNDVNDKYDIMLVDPNAKADEAYYLALYATRNLVIPAEPNRAGYESIEGVKRSAELFANAQDISITTLAVVPMFGRPSNKNIHKKYIEKFSNEYHAPVYFKDIGAFEAAEDQFVTLQAYLDDLPRIRSYQQRLKPKFRTLAAAVYAKSGEGFPEGVWAKDDLWWGDKHWDVDPMQLPKSLQKDKPAEVA